MHHHPSLSGKCYLITGITDDSSLAMTIAKRLSGDGARIVCTGLGRTGHHPNLSDKAAAFLDRTYLDFKNAVISQLGPETPVFALDVTQDASIEDTAAAFLAGGLSFDGILHSIAMDKTIRGGSAKPLLEVSREEFFDAMDVSAYSLIALVRAMLRNGRLRPGASILALSYLGAERVMSHPYKNIGVAKAALERITMELAQELGKQHQMRANVIRFSPFTASKAGGAIPGLEETVARCEETGALGNARPEDLAEAATFLLRPGVRITGEVLHVDGGYHMRG